MAIGVRDFLRLKEFGVIKEGCVKTTVSKPNVYTAMLVSRTCEELFADRTDGNYEFMSMGNRLRLGQWIARTIL